MHKKILAICAALVALGALAIPAAASAAVTLRESGTTVPVGAKITANGEEESIFAGGELTVKCSENWITGEVVKNNGTNVEGTIESAAFQGAEAGTKCNGGSLLGPTTVKIPALTNTGDPGTGTGTGHWCIKNIAGEDKFEVLGRKCGGTETSVLTFILEGNITCTYKRETTPVTGTSNTTANATLTVTGEPTFNKEAVSNILCPATGKIIQMKFTLSTDNAEKTPLQFDDVS